MHTIDHHLHVNDIVRKKETNLHTLKALTLETIHSRYPNEEWLHIYTDAGAGIFSNIFSFYSPAGTSRTAFDGEIKAIHTALNQQTLHSEKFTNAVLLIDSKS